MENKNYEGVRTFNELLDKEYGKIGSPGRNRYEEHAQMFIVGEMLKKARKEANLTQEELAKRAGTRKSYISKLENAKGNIQLYTLTRIFEHWNIFGDVYKNFYFCVHIKSVIYV